jgi:hypothetical protein
MYTSESTNSMWKMSSRYSGRITSLCTLLKCSPYSTLSNFLSLLFFPLVLTAFDREQSTWSFLLAFKSAAQIVPRFSLVTEMLRNSDVTRFITSLLPDAIKGGYVHHTLLAFNAATLSDFIIHSKTLDEGTVAFLLPALLEPLQTRSSGEKPLPKDAIVSLFIQLAAEAPMQNFISSEATSFYQLFPKIVTSHRKL